MVRLRVRIPIGDLGNYQSGLFGGDHGDWNHQHAW